MINKKISWFHYLLVVPIFIDIFTITLTFTLFYIKNPLIQTIFTKNLTNKIILTFIFYIISIFSLISHILSIITNNSIFYSKKKILFDKENLTIQNKNNNINNSAIYCSICKIYKINKIHHCSKCNICIDEMDHHCPWICNCVGKKNKKYFMLLLFYGFIGSLIGLITIFNQFLFVVLNKEKINENEKNNLINDFDVIKISAYYSLPFFGFTFSALSMVFCYIFLCNQLYSVYVGMNFVDIKKCKNKNNFNKNFWNNFKNVFGNNIFMWFLPI